MSKIIVCKECGKKGKHGAFGLCKICYNKQYKNSVVIVCKECGEKKEHHALGLCKKCYVKQVKRRTLVCKKCGKYGEHSAFGLCKKCYAKQLKPKVAICKGCGKKTSTMNGTRCQSCYHKQRHNNRQRYFCVDCGTEIAYRSKRCKKCNVILLNKTGGYKPKQETIEKRIKTVKKINSKLSKQELSKKYGSFFNKNNPSKRPNVLEKIRESKLGEKNPNWKPKIKKICPICKKEFEHIPSVYRICCSKSCFSKYQSVKFKKNNPMKMLDSRKKMSSTVKQKWKDPVYSEKRIKLWHKSPNKLEKQISDLFQKNNIPFKFSGDGSFWVTAVSGKHRCPDFVNPALKKVVLVCGKHWHTKEGIEEQINDYESRGFAVLVLWDKEIIAWNSCPYILKESLIMSNIKNFIDN